MSRISVNVKKANEDGKPFGKGKFFIVVISTTMNTDYLERKNEVTEIRSERFNSYSKAKNLKEKVIHSMGLNLVNTLLETSAEGYTKSGCGKSIWASLYNSHRKKLNIN
jgi:hypothetical protein